MGDEVVQQVVDEAKAADGSPRRRDARDGHTGAGRCSATGRRGLETSKRPTTFEGGGGVGSLRVASGAVSRLLRNAPEARRPFAALPRPNSGGGREVETAQRLAGAPGQAET